MPSRSKITDWIRCPTADPRRPLRRAAAPLRLRRAGGAALCPRSSAASAGTSKGCWRSSRPLHTHQHTIAIGIVGNQLVVADTPMPKASARDGRAHQAAQGSQDRADRVRARHHRRGSRPPSCTPSPRSGSEARRRNRPGRSRTSGSAGSSPRERRSDGIGGDMAAIRQLYSNAVVDRRSRLGKRRDRRQAGPAGDAAGRRRARRRRHAEPHGARRADRDAQLRQLHVHAHGERVDPDDGPGERARDRGTAAARVRPVGADARHRQGPDAEGDPEQARQADRRRVHHHAAARRGRRRDPAAHAGDADPRAGGRLRAPPAHRRHRLSVRRQRATA